MQIVALDQTRHLRPLNAVSTRVHARVCTHSCVCVTMVLNLVPGLPVPVRNRGYDTAVCTHSCIPIPYCIYQWILSDFSFDRGLSVSRVALVLKIILQTTMVSGVNYCPRKFDSRIPKFHILSIQL